MSWNGATLTWFEPEQCVKPAERYHELMQPKFTIAHMFDGDECYQLWSIKFDSAQEAKDWIKQNHPESWRTQQWIVVQFPDGVMM